MMNGNACPRLTAGPGWTADDCHEPAPLAVIDDDAVDALVVELNRMHRRASLDVALTMGKLIVDRFYGGNPTLWRVHKTREASFRRLAARAEKDLCVSPTLLYRSVALYELAHRLGPERIGQHTLSHLRVVLGLPEEEQIALLEMAAEEKWPSARLEVETAKRRNAIEQRRGRPAAPVLVKAVRKLLSSWCRVEEVLRDDGDAAFSATDAQHARRNVEGVRDELRGLRKQLMAKWQSSI